VVVEPEPSAGAAAAACVPGAAPVGAAVGIRRAAVPARAAAANATAAERITVFMRIIPARRAIQVLEKDSRKPRIHAMMFP
jgi:hypothetical protein